MVMAYFKFEIHVSLLISCMEDLGPYGEILALVNDCIFLPSSQENKEKLILKIITSS